MSAAGPSLWRDWNLLQAEVVPRLVEICGSRLARVWSIGVPADAVALAVAYATAGGSTERLRAFSTGEGGAVRVSFAFGDLGCVPRASRKTWFRLEERRWIPSTAITERVVLREPAEPVDLITLRRAAGRPIPHNAISHLRAGGQLLLLDEPAVLPATRELRPAGGGGRLFRKGGQSAARSGATVEATDGIGTTLAERQRQEELVEEHVRLARSLARRFARRGEPVDDLEQVAYLALVKAARRFDASRQVAFPTYATVSIVGELKRHFRDRAWMLRVPRSVQELYLSVKRAREELGHELGHSPTIEQVATHLGVSDEDVLEAMEAGDSYWPASLDVGPTDESAKVDVPVVDGALDQALDRQCLQGLLPQLERREQVILKRLYFDGWTQQRVADEIGVSQMQVSRLLARVVANLRSRAER